MRLSSPFPVHHRHCSLGSTYLEPGQISGLLDGDGAFTLLRRRSSAGVRIRPQISLGMRDDDPTPLAVWESIRARRGAPLGVLLQSKTQRRHEWRVDRLVDVVEVTDWLSRYPLISPRGYRQLAALREAALILLRARNPGGGTRRLPAADIARLGELRDVIPARGSAPRPLPPAPTADAVSSDHRGFVLAGLLAADGTFALRNERSKFAPTISLVQRIDNLMLLEHFRERLGIGDIRIRPARLSRAPVAVWEITRLRDCALLVEFLRTYPLPASSPKAEQLDLLAASLDIRRRVTDGGRRHGARGSTELSTLAASLQERKGYRGRRLLCTCPSPSSPLVISPATSGDIAALTLARTRAGN
jgi:hypothetical protein